MENPSEQHFSLPSRGTAMVAFRHNGSEPVSPLTYADREQLRRLQDLCRRAEVLEGHATRRRALLLRDQYLFATAHGALAISAHALELGYGNVAHSLKWHTTAQLLLGINLKAANDDEREAAQYEVSQLARALATLESLGNEHQGLSDDEFFKWYKTQGRISGLAKRYLEANREAKRKEKMAGGEQADSASAKTPEERVAEMLENAAAMEIDVVAGIPSGKQGVFLFRHEGEKLRVLPLNVSAEAILGLSGYAPCPLSTAPADLRFYRLLLLTGAALVPDEMSNIPLEDVPVGDMANSSYDMLPANAMYLVERGLFSIAHARRDDGLIVEIKPHVDLGYSMGGNCYIDNLTRRRLAEHLVGEADAAQFGLAPVEGVAAPVRITGQTKTLTFTSKALAKPINLIIKPREMGSIFTYRVSPEFAPKASAAMPAADVAAFDRSFMPVLLKQQKDRAVTVTVGAKGIGLANGKAPAAQFDVEVQGTAKVQVMLEDLRRAMVGLMGLPMTGGLRWELDPKGLLLIAAQTEEADVRVFIQTLEPNRDQPTRSRALRERVVSLPRGDTPTADAA